MVPKNIVQKILEAHDVTKRDIESYKPSDPLRISIDHAITQDATGTMAWLEFEAIGIPRIRSPLAVSYIDHNTLQTDFRNMDDHIFLRTIAAKKGAILSRPGNGILHQVHLENYAAPYKTQLGSDSHTPTAGGIGAFAMGVGGLALATAMAGMPYEIKFPKVVKVNIIGELKRPWVTAMDVILELLRRLSVKGGVGKVFEYAGPGIKTLSVPERATITNMGAELGATTSIFPSDENTKRFLEAQKRPEDWVELSADEGAQYDEVIEINLSDLVPMVAQPHMPDRVVTVKEIADKGLKVDQVCIGSCTNASYQALATAASVLKGHTVHPTIEMTVSPGSKNVLKQLSDEGVLSHLIGAGARILEATCGPCIGMGLAPSTNAVSVRTFNRNFKGRSGTKSAGTYLVSPPTAALLAIRGKFVDPLKESEIKPEIVIEPKLFVRDVNMFIFPEDVNSEEIEVIKGPNIKECPLNEPLGSEVSGPVLLKTKDNITTDDIMMAGAKVLPLRSNIPAIAEFVFNPVDDTFVQRAKEINPDHKPRQFIVVGGENYGQGSSREHAAIAPLFLGLGAIIVKSVARIHRDNLIQWGMLPFEFVDKANYENIDQGDDIIIPNLEQLVDGETILEAQNKTKNSTFKVKIILSALEIEQLKEGGLLPWVRNQIS